LKTSITALFLLVGIVAVGSWFWSGAYTVAATQPHSSLVQWLLTTVRDRSIARHSRDIKAPDLSDTGLVKKGAVQYDAMCAVCHRAPGLKPTEISKGLNPPAPELRRTEIQRTYSDSALFWIVKHGIRMTGMPAFGPTHDDKDLWAIVAFTRRLPELQAEDYKILTEREGQNQRSNKLP
jgi:mono/diheme cytochrome c family protein